MTEGTVPDIREGTVLWQPSPERRAQSRMADYMRWLAERKGLRFDSYQALWQWSVTELEAFWASLWEYFSIAASAPYTRVLDQRTMPGAATNNKSKAWISEMIYLDTPEVSSMRSAPLRMAPNRNDPAIMPNGLFFASKAIAILSNP